MKFVLITGPAITIECYACQKHVVGGTEPYPSAATGEMTQPLQIYSEETHGLYCAECAVKLMSEDPTKAVSQFYTNTTGEKIDHARLISE